MTRLASGFKACGLVLLAFIALGFSTLAAKAVEVGNFITFHGGESSSWNLEVDDIASIEDASLDTNDLNDAYDGIWIMSIDGDELEATNGFDVSFLDLCSKASTGWLPTTNGVLFREEITVFKSAPISRALVSFHNPGTSSTTLTTTVFLEMGSDSDTTNFGTSSGDIILDAGDRWVVSGGDPSDPVNGIAYYGIGGQSPTGVEQDTDEYSATFSLVIPAGETRSLMFFSELNTNDTQALSRVHLFDDISAMRDIGLFSGLTPADVRSTVNWILPDWDSVNDFNGDSQSDLSVIATPAYQWYHLSAGSVFAQNQFGFGSVVPVPADYDGDGATDEAVYDPVSATWFLMRSTAGFTTAQFGFAGVAPVPADYDGDGWADVAVFDAANATWYLMRSTEGFVSVGFGSANSTPVPSDYDGNGTADLATYDPATSLWAIFFTETATPNYSQVFGFAGVIPVPADYDGDGATDIAVYSPADGLWYIQGTSAGFWTQQFGYQGAIPVPGDYDGDKAADFGVYDPISLIWYTMGSEGSFHMTTFGTTDSQPVGGKQ